MGMLGFSAYGLLPDAYFVCVKAIARRAFEPRSWRFLQSPKRQILDHSRVLS